MNAPDARSGPLTIETLFEGSTEGPALFRAVAALCGFAILALFIASAERGTA